MSSDTWGSRSHSNRNPDDNRTNNDSLTTTTITSLTSTNNNTNNPNPSTNPSHMSNHPNDNNSRPTRPYHSHSNNYRRNNMRHRRISRSRSYSKSRSRSRSHSINDSLSRSPTPKKRNMSNRHDHIRKRNGSRTYHSRRPKRHTRELPYPSRSRSRSTSKSRSPMSRSKSRSLSYSDGSDDGRRHRRHNRKRVMGRDNRYKHRHGYSDGRNGMRRRRNMNRGNNQMYNNNNQMYNNNNRNDNRHIRMNNNKRNIININNNNNNNTSTNDKVPVSFKEFTHTMLEDDVTASEAQKRYEKYLQRFSKSDDVLFFEGHKDEEWFQERYDPIIIEKSIESRREHARNNYLSFYNLFLNDLLPEVHDNINDFKLLGTEKQEHIKSEEDEPIDTTTIGTTTTTTTTKEKDKPIKLPKYCDIMYRDDYIPNRSGRMDGSKIEYSENECYENSIFIQGIPLHIQRCKIYEPFSKCVGFLKLILSDPIRNSRRVRYGWVTFDSQENCRHALLDVNEGGLNGHQLTGQYFMNLLPKQKSKRRPKFSPPESLYPRRVLIDIKHTLACCHKFDSEAGIELNPLLNNKLLSNLCLIRKLNILLLYLRRIHFLCYYCGKHFLSEEHMYARCSGIHERKVPADISLSISGNISLLNDQSQTIIKKEKTNWEKDLDSRISDVLNYVIDHKHCWIERKQIKMLEKNSKKISDGKFRCTICSKLFKAEIFVIKHIKNKHQDEIAKYIADQRLRTMFENYRRDRDRLTIRSFEDNNNNNTSNNNTSNKNKEQMQQTTQQITQQRQQQQIIPVHTQHRQPPQHPVYIYPQPQQHMHPERASNIMPIQPPPIQSQPQPQQPISHHRKDSNNNDPYGRKIPVHFEDNITRTRRSYRDVDIEYPMDEIEEEIDYGFGDFDKNPTKFNL